MLVATVISLIASRHDRQPQVRRHAPVQSDGASNRPAAAALSKDHSK